MLRKLVLSLIIFSSFEILAHDKLDYPTGGEVFHPGDVITIKWEILIQHNQENWDLYFSKDGGTSWEVIKENMPVSTLSYDWTVPDMETTNAKIKIVQDNVDYDYSDESGNFIITSGGSGGILAIAQTDLTFGYIEPNQSQTQGLAVMNTGSDQLKILSLSDLNAPFSATSDNLPIVLEAGGKTTVSITYAPTRDGTSSQKITISSDAGSSEVNLKGMALTPASAMAATCYAVTGLKDGGRLISVDMTSGKASLIEDLDLDLSTAVASDDGGFLYVIDAEKDALFKADIASGEVVSVYDLMMDDVSIDFSSDGTLYIIGVPTSGDRQMFFLDVASMDLETIGPVSQRITGLSTNPVDDKLYGITVDGELYLFNKDDGSSSMIGSSGLSNVTDLAFDADGVLYAIYGGGKASDNTLAKIDPSDGSILSTVGNLGFTAVSGLTFTPKTLSEQQPLEVPTHRIAVYPNPTSERLTMDFDKLPSVVSIYSLSGSLVFHTRPKNTHLIWEGVNLSGGKVANGIYVLNVDFADQKMVKKVVVER